MKQSCSLKSIKFIICPRLKKANLFLDIADYFYSFATSLLGHVALSLHFISLGELNRNYVQSVRGALITNPNHRLSAELLLLQS